MELKTIDTKMIGFYGVARPYDIMSRNVTPSPRYFVSYGNGRPFISDEVPEKYRGYMIFHELAEFEFLKGNNRCLNALQIELSRVPKEEVIEYARFRRETFQSLVDFLEKHEPSSKLIPEVRKSLNHLQRV